MASLDVSEWVTEISDDELFQRLKDFGADPGPIQASTRRVYERKLMDMMLRLERGEPVLSPPQSSSLGLPAYGGENLAGGASSSEGEDEFVDDDAPVTPPRPVYTGSPGRTPRPASSYGRRVVSETTTKTTSYASSLRQPLDESADGLTRRPLREAQMAASTSPALNGASSETKQAQGGGVSTPVKVVILLVLIIFIVLVYLNFESSPENPVKSLGD